MHFLQDYLREGGRGVHPLVQGVYIENYEHASTGLEQEAKLTLLNALCSMTSLTELTLPACPLDIRLIAEHLGGTLVKLDVCLESNSTRQSNATDECDILYADYFSGFSHLEVLWLRCGAKLPRIAGPTGKGASGDSFSEDVRLAKLRLLTVQDYEDAQVFNLLSHWECVHGLSFLVIHF